MVREYISTNTFTGTLQMQTQLLEDYKEDIRKYADGLDQTRILNIFQHIPVQLAKDNKKFQISKVAKGARFKDYRGCIEWLKDTGLVNVCYCLQYPEWREELGGRTSTVKSPQITGMPGAHSGSDATANLAERRVELREKMQKVEDTVREAVGDNKIGRAHV